MWFASIWIFTLELPWVLGADFFMRHLLDGDAASNTLSWRWVAGLQTRGKTYRATRQNIVHYTEGRLDPGPRLAGTATPLEEPPVTASALPNFATALADDRPSLLLLHDDDLGIATLDLSPAVRAVCVGIAPHARCPAGVSEPVAAFTSGLADDALAQALAAGRDDGGRFDLTDAPAAAASMLECLRRAGAERVVAAFAPVGAVRDALDPVKAQVRSAGAEWIDLGRTYDAVAWPHATRGFFALRAKIPSILAALGLDRPESLSLML